MRFRKKSAFEFKLILLLYHLQKHYLERAEMGYDIFFIFENSCIVIFCLVIISLAKIHFLPSYFKVTTEAGD